MKTRMVFPITMAALVLLTTTTAPPLRAATNALNPGSLDSSFCTTNSFLYLSNNPGLLPVMALELDAQGRVYVAGSFTNVNGIPGPGLVRLLPNGTVDRSYGPPWETAWFVRNLTLQPDQKLLVLGGPSLYGGMHLSRLNSDGSLDPSFLNESWSGGVLLQPDGKIVLVSLSDRVTVLRLNADGTRDWSFAQVSLGMGPDGYLKDYALQPNGGILVSGSFGFRRFHSNGTEDYSFNPQRIEDGRLWVQPDNRILVWNDHSQMFRLNADGTLDNTFLTNRFTNSVPMGIAVQPDGRMLAAVMRATAQIRYVEICRLESNGAQDLTFSAKLYTDGLWSDWRLSMLLEPDGRLLVGARFFSVNGIPVNHVARLNGEQAPVLRALGLPGPPGFLIELTGGPSQRYAVEVSSNLVAWSVAGDVTNTPSGTCHFTDAPAPVSGQRFYRARRNP